MSNIINFQNYKLQKQFTPKLSKTSEKDIANQILASFQYNDKNIAIPIVKIAKSYGIGVFRETFDKKEDTNIAGKLCINGPALERCNCSKLILVNKSDHIFEQRVIIANMLGHYLIDKPKQNIEITYDEVYQKHKEFILNILAPDQVFIEEHNSAVDDGFSKIEVYMYLKRFFEVSETFVDQKIKSLR